MIYVAVALMVGIMVGNGVGMSVGLKPWAVVFCVLFVLACVGYRWSKWLCDVCLILSTMAFGAFLECRQTHAQASPLPEGRVSCEAIVVGMPQQHEFGIAGNQFGCDGVEEGVGAMQDDHVGLYLVNDLLKVAVVGKRYVLTGNLDGRGYAVNLYPVDGVHTGDAVLTEADDNMLEIGQTFGHVFRDGLDAALYRIIIFGYLEYSFLHRQSVFFNYNARNSG